MNSVIQSLTPESLAKYFDHTLLRPNATRKDFVVFCEDCKKYGFKMAAINPGAVELCKKLLQNSDVRVGAAIGFPLGQTTIESKVFETRDAIEKGADEKLGVPFYDGCDNKFDEMRAKMKGVDKAAEDYRFTIFYDPDSDTYWIDNSLQLFFENQEAVITTYLKENGYQLISMTGEK